MRSATALTLALTTALALSACGGREEPAPAPTPTATVAAPRTLVAADFDSLELGGKIEGPQGTEVETVLSDGEREIGTMVSYVACPKGTIVCKPGATAGDTVFTYVHRITLADADADVPPTTPVSGAPSAAPTEAPATIFRTVRAVPGFGHAVGFSRKEARAALGEVDAIDITSDGGRLIWRVTKGAGWKPGASITFWWTSTEPPAGPADAFLLETGGATARARGPFPAPAKSDDKPAAR